jgi:hypothetical protein
MSAETDLHQALLKSTLSTAAKELAARLTIKPPATPIEDSK